MAKRRNGNPKTADGFIRISNELWDAWMCSRFTAREERMIKVVIRFSYPECEYVFFREALSPEGKLDAQPIRNFMAAGGRPAGRPSYRGRSSTTSGAPGCGIWSAPAFRKRSP